MLSDYRDRPLLVKEIVANYGELRDSPALIAGRSVTYGQLHDAVNEWSVYLANHGIRRGTTVALRVHPSFTYVYLLYALWNAGAGIILLDPRLRQDEVNELLERTKPEFLIRDMLQGSIPVFKEELEIAVEALSRSVDCDAESEPPFALLSFSSGTTGRPKAIARNSGAIRDELERLAAIPHGIRADDTVAVLSSIHHTYGLVGGVMMSLSTGAAVVFPPSPQSVSILEALTVTRTTVMFGVPFHYEQLSRMTAVQGLCLRAAICGGEFLHATAAERFRERFGISVGQAYGTTETGMLAADWLGDYSGTVGKPLKGIEWSIHSGELLIRMPQSPYADEMGRERYADGWLHTRDAAEFDKEAGLLKLHGRLDSIRIIGGLKVDVLETERRIAEYPHVEEVRVIFRDDDRMEAYIVGGPEFSMPGLTDWCRRHIAGYKLPRAFHQVAALPRTISGKPVRDPAAIIKSAPWQPSGNMK
jgi:acyl-coenzyme A synthetase/AMP-(fatty) acid ligase